MSGNFDFANPGLLWLLAAIPFLALLKGRAGSSGTLVFSSVAIAKSVSRKNKSRAGAVLTTLRMLALALLIAALARPRMGKGFSEREESGIDIVLAIDVSNSMSALDLSTSTKIQTRLDAVKSVVQDCIKNRPHDRIGMVVFGVNTFLVSPVTLSHDWLNQNIERVELGLIDGRGTAIGKAILSAANHMRALKDAKSRVVILLSDGESNTGISPVAAAEAAASFDIKIYTIAA
ncbi:MAG: VWA domain-containing protein, partial [Opitutales bacterium]|nr:VWA domain-containing protein [Opitutales bacterium]